MKNVFCGSKYILQSRTTGSICLDRSQFTGHLPETAVIRYMNCHGHRVCSAFRRTTPNWKEQYRAWSSLSCRMYLRRSAVVGSDMRADPRLFRLNKQAGGLVPCQPGNAARPEFEKQCADCLDALQLPEEAGADRQQPAKKPVAWKLFHLLMLLSRRFQTFALSLFSQA